MSDREARREMSFEEEATLYEQEARKVFAKEDNIGEAPIENQIISRGMRIIRKARTALQERKERSKGCKYCADHKYNVEDCVMLSHDEYDSDRGMYIYDGELISNSGEFQCVKINFCPICGRLQKGKNNETD